MPSPVIKRTNVEIEPLEVREKRYLRLFNMGAEEMRIAGEALTKDIHQCK